MPKSLSNHAVKGMAFAGVALIITKVFAFTSQIVLGNKLSDGDYKLYGLAIGFEIYVAAFRNTWVAKILMQRGKEVQQLAKPFALLSLISNCISALLLLAIVYAIKTYDQQLGLGWYTPGLLELVYWVAASYVISSFPDIYITQLKIQLQFKTVELIRVGSQLCLNGSMIIFALLGYGPLSFVMPLLIFAMFRWAACLWVQGKIPKGRNIDRQLLKEIYKPAIWLMLGAALYTVTLYGDYNIVGFIAPHLLGSYFFGFRLVGAFLAVFAESVTAVMLPMFVNVSDEQHRQQAGFQKALNGLIFITAPISMGAFLIGHPLVHFVWNGTWDPAIQVVQYIGLSLVFQSVMPLAMALFEARGAWKLRLFLLAVDGLGVVIAATIGSLIGTLHAISAAIILHRLIMSIVYLYHSCKIINLKMKPLYIQLSQILLLNLTAVTVAYHAASLLLFEQNQIDPQYLLDAIRIILFCSFWAILVMLFKQATIKQMIAMLIPKTKSH